ncbi:hypothetical protein [Pedobacter sp. FW305-3-2-15-E-R2A2]|uniref:hypothetical protein n=1 Tax=Pedobacter sp. FW305-3-2-15-E-R2A2 TaxID=3140251 RepID=UPI0031405F42
MKGIGVLSIYEFSNLNPDEPEGIVNTFSTVNEATNFSLMECGTELDKFFECAAVAGIRNFSHRFLALQNVFYFQMALVSIFCRASKKKFK